MPKFPRWLAALLFVGLLPWPSDAVGNETGPVYQQRSTHAGHHWHHPGYSGHRNQSHMSSHAPVQQSSSFQRPYPYHLDYYRMRYGGSYAPYFGNLYGPPQVYAPTSIQGGGYGGGVPYGAYPGQPTIYGQPVEVPVGTPTRTP